MEKELAEREEAALMKEQQFASLEAKVLDSKKRLATIRKKQQVCHIWVLACQGCHHSPRHQSTERWACRR